MACILRRQIPCDWNEVVRIAALPAYRCAAELEAVRQEVQAELASRP